MASCATIQVSRDYEPQTNFSTYSTYNFYPEMETGLGDLDTKRLLRAVDSVMMDKGHMLSEEPDFYVNITSNSQLLPRQNTVGMGVGGTGGNLGGGISIGLPLGKAGTEYQITFDLVDPRKDQLFWQGIATLSWNANATPEAKERKLCQVVGKVFAQYPPKK